MRWLRFAVAGIGLLLGVVTVLWCGSVWIHNEDFRMYLILNAAVVCPLCLILLFALRFLNWNIALWLAGKMHRWLLLWAGIGLLLSAPLFLLDRFARLYMREQFLFTLWPSNVPLMVLEDSRGGFLMITSLSVAVNAAIYAGWSALVWWLVSLLNRVRQDRTPTRLFPE